MNYNRKIKNATFYLVNYKKITFNRTIIMKWNSENKKLYNIKNIQS